MAESGLLRRARRAAGRRSPVIWRYASNLRPVVEHRLTPRPTGPAQRAVLDDLRRDGFAVATLDDLLPLRLDALREEAERLRRAHRASIAMVREGQPGPWAHKPYVVPLLGDEPTWDVDSLALGTALHDGLSSVADRWFGMRTTVRECNYLSTPARAEQPRSSQLWHRDILVDHVMLKCFVYLSDVDATSGPLSYVAGTHDLGRLRLAPSGHLDRHVLRVEDDEMRAAAPPAAVKVIEGRPGTVVFIDTSGWHRGGHATAHDRLVWMCQYASLGSWRPAYFRRPDGSRVTRPIPAQS